MFSLFASDGPHTSIKPESLFEIAGITVTNSMLFGWICAILIIFLLIAAQKRLRVGGKKSVAEVIEVGTEFIMGLVHQSFNNREKTLKYAPIFVTMFFFILFNNILGLFPGVGTSIVYNGQPLLKAFTTDLNGTAAMAIFGMVIVQIISIKESGLKKHTKHYFPLHPLNPANYLIGAFEIFTELTRLLSLGLRLFLNIAIGEVLISVAAYLGSGLAPITALPFTLLEVGVSILQAFIFVVLCIAYLSATMSHGEHSEEHTK